MTATYPVITWLALRSRKEPPRPRRTCKTWLGFGRVLEIATYPAEGFGSSYKVHSLDQLKVLAALDPDIRVTKHKELFDNWSIAVKWDPEQRYDPPGTYDRQAAKDILDSIQTKPNGVLTWLTKRW